MRRVFFSFGFVVATLVLAATSCPPTGPVIVVTIDVVPAGNALAKSGIFTFGATVTGGCTSCTVTWSATAGTMVPATGDYTAPAAVPAGGKVTITATSDEDVTASDSVEITILAGDPDTLGVPTAKPVSPDGTTSTFDLPTPDGDEKYVVIVNSLSAVVGAIFSVTVSDQFARDLAQVHTVPASSADPHTRVLMMNRQIGLDIAAGRIPAPDLTPRAGRGGVPCVGPTKAFKAFDFSSGGSFTDPANYLDVTGALVSTSGTRACVYVDTSGTMTLAAGNATLMSMAADYNVPGGLYDRVVATFGGHSDINGDGHIDILITDALADAGGDLPLANGLFGSIDVSPGACADPDKSKCSNMREVLYVRDKISSESDADYRTVTEPTWAHELQHLINFGVSPTEDVWLNEALSSHAETLLAGGYDDGGDDFQTRVFLGAVNTMNATCPPGAGCTGPQDFGVDNDDTSPFGHRGGSYLFLRYLIDRGLGTPKEFEDAVATGRANIAEVTGRSFADNLRDWSAALYLHENVAVPHDPIFNYDEPDPASPAAFLRGVDPDGVTLTGPKVTTGPFPRTARGPLSCPGGLDSSAVCYFEIGPADADPGMTTVTVTGGAGSMLQVTTILIEDPTP